MRIFIKELVLDKLNLKKLEEYRLDIKEKILILTEKNILQIKNQEIYKIKPIDIPIIIVDFKDIKLLIDKSYWKLDSKEYQIPINHYIQKIKIEEYKLNKLDEISLKIEYIYKNNIFELFDIYFYINDNSKINVEDIDLFNIQILDTFLSLLRNVN